jgi:membrane protein DedA with SNARE-associated domain
MDFSCVGFPRRVEYPFSAPIPFARPPGKMADFLGSYLAITIVMILTGAGLPIPEEVPIIAAGVLSAPPNASLNPFAAVACCLFGALVGDCIMYWIGYHFGRGVLRDHRWFARCVTPEREEQIERMFCRHGLKVFFVARFLVGLRTPVYLTAGILRVSFKRFLLIDLICATAVVGTFFSLTYIWGAPIAEFFSKIERWGAVAVVIAVACVGFFLWRRYRKKKLAETSHPIRSEVPPPTIQKESTLDNVEEVEETV